MAVTEVHGWYGYYHGYGYPYFYHGGKTLGPVKMEDVDYGKTGIKYLEKRDAEADPEADPQLIAYHPYFYSHPYVPLTVEARNKDAFGFSRGAQVVLPKLKMEKRSAEADPEADPHLFAYHPYVYGYHYAPVAVEKATPDAYGFAAGFKPAVVVKPKEE